MASFGLLCFQLPLWAICISNHWELPSNRGLEDELPTNRGFEDELAEIAASAIHDKTIRASIFHMPKS